MVFLSVMSCVIYTIIIVSILLKKPLLVIFHYPPKIREKVEKLGLIENEEPSIIQKLSTILFFGFFFGVIVYIYFYCSTFQEAFWKTFILWNILNLYDVFIIDLLWFCHSEGVKIKGTEDMKEYSNVKFHIMNGFKGMIIGLLVSCISGFVIQFIQYLFF